MAIKNHQCKCTYCGGDAYVYTEDRRYMVRCLTCGANDYLKIIAGRKTKN